MDLGEQRYQAFSVVLPIGQFFAVKHRSHHPFSSGYWTPICHINKLIAVKKCGKDPDDHSMLYTPLSARLV
jgi:hypothetical protein